MARARKSFDKELMYKKIMPTNLKKNNESDTEGIKGEGSDDNTYQEGLVSINANTVYLNETPKFVKNDLENINEIDRSKLAEETSSSDEPVIADKINETEEAKGEETATQNIDIRRTEIIHEDENGIIIYNVMESLVMEKLDITLQKMNCCKCDRCKDDIVALALNSLKPMYIVGTSDEIESRKSEFSKLGLEVTTAVLKSVLAVRRNPRH